MTLVLTNDEVKELAALLERADSELRTLDELRGYHGDGIPRAAVQTTRRQLRTWSRVLDGPDRNGERWTVPQTRVVFNKAHVADHADWERVLLRLANQADRLGRQGWTVDSVSDTPDAITLDLLHWGQP